MEALMRSDNDWWKAACARADATTKRQMGKSAFPAPSARERVVPHKPASVRTRAMLSEANKERAERNQPLIPLD